MAKTNCDYCQLIESKTNLIYEDAKVVAMLAPKPAAIGHIIVLPREHYPIIEQVPDFIVSDLFVKANKISIALFEGLGAHGTNIIVQNGVSAGQKSAHFMVHIIPRKEGDKLDFNWKPRQLTEEEMSTVEIQLKEASAGIGSFQKEPEKPVEIEKKVEKIKAGKEENYLIKQLERIP
jgi:histidine triad (HIT) family protein